MSGEIGSGAEGRKLFDVVRDKMRTRHMAYRTEQAYLQWIRRYIAFHKRRHPRDLGATEVEQFLTHLAVDRKVGPSTQSQALQALLFLYRSVLAVDLPWLENVTRAERPRRLPVVLNRAEVRAILANLEGTPWIVANLLYGGGLRVLEALRLRVKDLVLGREDDHDLHPRHAQGRPGGEESAGSVRVMCWCRAPSGSDSATALHANNPCVRRDMARIPP
jgi:integrase